MHFEGTLDDEKLNPFLQKKADLQEDIEQQKTAFEALKKARKDTPHHIDANDLPEEHKFKQLSTQSKHLVDTIKMTAYRAETAMANSVREPCLILMKRAPYFVRFIKLKQTCSLIWTRKH
jgi:hypothetical protein